MLKAILFDLDETLIDRDITMRNFLVGQYGRFVSRLDCEHRVFVEAVISHQAGGYADKRTAYRNALSELGLDSGLLDDIMMDFEAEYGNEAAVFPGACDVLATLRRDYTIGLVTNGRSLSQRNKLRSAGLGELFDAVIISEEVGIRKPDTRIFFLCLQRLNIRPEEALYVGDNPENDIAPAVRTGMKAVWLKNDRFRPPLGMGGVISAISELPGELEALDCIQP